jgi:CheY-like chemotaxis protein
MTVKNIHLIIAGDIPQLYRLPELATHQGFPVRVCLNGTEALQASVSHPPRLMVIAMDLPLLSAGRLVRILRKNPKTSGVDLLLLGDEGQDKEVSGLLREGSDHFFPRPLNQEQLLRFILGTLKRYGEEFAEMERSVIEGDIRQMSLVDLLQVFNLNRKDGMLTLEQGRTKGVIYLLEGNVINARVGEVNGIKAFFRLLCWGKGKFRFAQGTPGSDIRIKLPTDHLIMEGLRQKDEMEAMAGSLPPLDGMLRSRVPRENLPQGLRPSTREVINLLEYYEKVGDILDHASHPDLEILHILKVLLDRKILEYQQEDLASGQDQRPLLKAWEVAAIRDGLEDKEVLPEEGSAKILALYSCPEDLRLLTETLKGVREFQTDPALARPGGAPWSLGDLGRFQVGDSFFLRLVHLPAAVEAGPLWPPFCRRLIGVLSLPPHENKEKAEAFFRDRDVAVVRVGFRPEEEGSVHLLPAGRDGWRRLLADLTAAFLAHRYVKREEP